VLLELGWIILYYITVKEVLGLFEVSSNKKERWELQFNYWPKKKGHFVHLDRRRK
jgi:hypothetical protein